MSRLSAFQPAVITGIDRECCSESVRTSMRYKPDEQLPSNMSVSNFHPARVSFFFGKNGTRADLSLGRWPAAIPCFFSDRTAFSVKSLTFRRAGLPSCASQQKRLPCGQPLPEHETTTLDSFLSKQTTGYTAFGSRRGITLSCTYQY